jgi:MFS family permease
MREMWRHRGIRLIFLANLISMVGSGMNSAAVIWYILQATHSEVSLGALIALQTIPSLLLLPFTGVLIDREDRRHLMMWLDAARGLIILSVAILAITHRVALWHVYLMNVLVAIGFWMFFPTVNALIQELTPDDRMLDSNSLLLAALQGGWLMAGALVGFVYNHIGLGGVLLIDAMTYAVSIACVFHVRKGRVTVTRPGSERVPSAAEAGLTSSDISDGLRAIPFSGPLDQPADSALARYLAELREGYQHICENRRVLLIGIAWALFVAAMMTQGVLSAPLSDRLLHAGAVGYGWLNAGWAVGAFVAVFYATSFIRKRGANFSVTLTMSTIAACLFLLPVSHWLVLAVPIYFVMGSSRGVGGIALSSEMMQLVPRYIMGRVQNAFSFVANSLQICTALLVGEAAHRDGLRYGFWIVGIMYLSAAMAAWLPVRSMRALASQRANSAAD